METLENGPVIIKCYNWFIVKGLAFTLQEQKRETRWSWKWMCVFWRQDKHICLTISAMSLQNRLFLWTPFLPPTLPPRSSWSGNRPMNPTGTSLTTWSFASASLKPVSCTSLTTVRKVSRALVPCTACWTEFTKLIIQPASQAQRRPVVLFALLWNDPLAALLGAVPSRLDQLERHRHNLIN